jgi:hypothetical protein
MAVITDESGAPLLAEAPAHLFDEAGPETDPGRATATSVPLATATPGGRP